MPNPIDCSPEAMRVLVDGALEHMKKLGHGSHSIKQRLWIWGCFVRFVAESGQAAMTFTALTRAFLDGRGIEEHLETAQLRPVQANFRLAMRVLTDFALHGCFPKRQRIGDEIPLSREFSAVVSGFERHLRDTVGLAPPSIVDRRRTAARLLHYLDSHGVTSVATIDPRLLPGFAASRSYQRPMALDRELSAVRTFLRYLCMAGFVPATLVDHLPRVRVRRNTSIPSVWKREEVDALLAVVDRGSAMGKRDYAILLLAARLGIRAGDVRALRLEHLRWDQARIEFRQSKTGVPQSLPLTEEIGEALIDYLRHGRPPTEHREVFLKATAPIVPFPDNNKFYAVITRYRLLAGIGRPRPGRLGLHSLRHTVATRLLEAGTPMETISSVMGHVSPETTRIYTKVDIEALRRTAIDTEAADE